MQFRDVAFDQDGRSQQSIPIESDEISSRGRLLRSDSEVSMPSTSRMSGEGSSAGYDESLGSSVSANGPLMATTQMTHGRHRMSFIQARESMLSVRSPNPTFPDMFPSDLLERFTATNVIEARLHPFLDHTTRELLDHSYRVYWPGFRPGGHTVNGSWLMNILEHPYVFHSLMWAAALHMNALRPDGRIDRSSLMHQQRAVQHLSREINEKGDLDENWHLIAIMALGTPESVVASPPKPTHSFTPPLRDLLWLNVYSRHPLIEAHWKALLYVVESRGGQDMPSMEFHNYQIHVADAIQASLKLSAPSLPLCQRFRELREIENRNNAFGVVGVEIAFEAFGKAISLPEFALPASVIEALIDIYAYTALLGHHSEEVYKSHNLAKLGLHRVLIQLQLMSALFSTDDSATEAQPPPTVCFAEVIKSAALLFALAVTFPVSNPEPVEVVVGRLKAALENVGDDASISNAHQDIYVWACMLGALGASDAPQKDWFVSQLALQELERTGRTPGASQCSSWDEVYQVFARFLWLDMACNTAAQELWLQVQEKMTTRLNSSRIPEPP
jgi:hypothetical protein